MGKQELSIGENCDDLGIVEHEFLHALGFWHEQSRFDRDDYVTIVWNQIKAGDKNNFILHNDTVSSSFGLPYDYSSVMHYRKTAFSKTASASTFLDSCHFEEPNICGMIQGDGGNAKWARVQRVKGGPQTDYTNLGRCQGAGFFMHFSTATGTRGDTAYLESRLFYPKRRSQCLQFYHYNSGGANDQLNIWVREYTTENPKGPLRLIQKISGGHQGSWELYHVTLDVSDKFRVVFEGVKGRKRSKGGLSLDDVNLSETKCPQYTWRIRNFTSLLATTPTGYETYSPRYLSPDGYSFHISLYINGVTDRPNKMAIYFHLTSGPYDDKLQWPCPWRQASMELMDQHPDIQHRMNNIRMITTDPTMNFTDSKGNVKYFWDNPQKVGSRFTDSNGNSFYRGPGYGYISYITHERLKSQSFIKGNDAIFLFSLEGKEHNFNSCDETESSNLGVPYDYSSVMHYGKKSYSKSGEPTIVTKIPEFLDVIGQRMEFSDSDLLKLNRLCNCTTTTTFLDSCHFEEPNICGMIQGDGGNAKWARVQTVEGGPQTDYTNLGQCQGGLQGSWELYHVTLDVFDKFRVVFEGVKGGGTSTGGLSLDDINLSETQCPQHTWRIRDFTSLLATTPDGSKTYSPRFLSPDGYSFQIALYIKGVTDNPDNMAVYLHLTSGPNDDSLQWPCPWRQASMELMDQNPNIQHRMNNRMVTTDPTKTSTDCKIQVYRY
ncbi:meprin A subunit beta-like protein [Labeo rohita]|uniref:Meprin A subunit beta-like protein n=1 Tax=Labeo rohita TaxID=84645 RepID=A0A498M7R7_LABRO|nr:meprin A subunit beta-like protein [Labeo rohita]